MRYFICVVIVFVTFCNNLKAQNIAPLLQDFTNLYTVSHSETYLDNKGLPINNSRSTYVDRLHNFIKVKDIDPNRLNSITDLVTSDPSILKPYLESNTHDFAVFVLLSSIYNIEIQDEDEKFIINAIYGSTFNESFFGNIPPNEILHNAWIETRESSIARVKSIVGID